MEDQQKIFSSENFSENFLLENEKKLTKKEKTFGRKIECTKGISTVARKIASPHSVVAGHISTTLWSCGDQVESYILGGLGLKTTIRACF